MARSRLLGFHRWLGLALGPFLFLQVVTGAFLVASNLLPATSPRPAMGDIARMASRIEAALPGYRLTRLYAPESGRSAFAELAGARGTATYAQIETGNGASVRSGPLWHFPYRAAVQLHYRLASGNPGMIVVLLTGLALTLAALFGFLYWWPGMQRLRAALKLRNNLPERQRLRHRHRTIGAWTVIPALFSAATGLALIVPDILAVQALAPASVAVVAADPARAGTAQIEAALIAAQHRFPDAALRDVRFPLADRIDINFHAPERSPRAVHVVSVRLSDGAVLKAIPAQDNPVLWMKILPLHTGQSLGLPGGLLLLAETAALLFLVWAGTRMWLSRRRKD